MLFTLPKPRLRWLTSVAATAVLATGLAACGSSDDAAESGDKVELVFATGETETSPHQASANWFMEEVTKRTDGRVTWKKHYSGSLLPSTEIAGAVKDGRIDSGTFTSPYDPANFPLYNVGYVPFNDGNTVGAARALDRMFEENDALKAEAERNNARFLIHVGSSNSSTVSVKKPLESLSDIDGAKIRAIGSLAPALTTAGANPMAIPVEETFEAVERGVIDGIAGTPIAALVSYKIPQILPHTYFLPTGHYTSSIGLMIGQDRWESLPEDIREVMEDVRDEHYKRLPEVSTEREAVACDAVLADGGTVGWFPAAESEREAWLGQVGNAMFDDWRKSAKKAGVSDADIDSVEDDFKRIAAEESAKATDYTPGEDACIAKSAAK